MKMFRINNSVLLFSSREISILWVFFRCFLVAKHIWNLNFIQVHQHLISRCKPSRLKTCDDQCNFSKLSLFSVYCPYNSLSLSVTIAIDINFWILSARCFCMYFFFFSSLFFSPFLSFYSYSVVLIYHTVVCLIFLSIFGFNLGFSFRYTFIYCIEHSCFVFWTFFQTEVPVVLVH